MLSAQAAADSSSAARFDRTSLLRVQCDLSRLVNCKALIFRLLSRLIFPDPELDRRSHGSLMLISRRGVIIHRILQA